MDRRNILKAAGGAVALGAWAPSAAKAVEADNCGRVIQPTTFVLVHGGWGGGYNYAEVAEILRRRGHRVFNPTLTGVGDRSHLATPDVNLETHITDITNLIRFHELTDIVLAGHSSGGAVISGVGDRMHERIASIVFLDAFLLEDGHAIIDDAGQVPFLQGTEQGDYLEFPFAEAMGIPEEELWRFTPQPIATLTDPVSLTGGFASIPIKTFVKAENWHDHDEVFARLQQDPDWRTVTIPTGHGLMEEAPEMTAQFLENASPHAVRGA